MTAREDQPGTAALNTDRELWRATPGDYYSDSVHVTEGGGIGINVGGSVIVLPLKAWHSIATKWSAMTRTPAEDQPRPTPPMDIGGSDAFHDWPKVEAEATPEPPTPATRFICGHGTFDKPCEICKGSYHNAVFDPIPAVTSSGAQPPTGTVAYWQHRAIEAEDRLREYKDAAYRLEETIRLLRTESGAIGGATQGSSPRHEFSSPPLTEKEMEHCSQIAESLPIVAHPQMYPDSARELFDGLLTLKYNEEGRWRVQAEFADGTKAIIAVNNRQDGEQARAQIRGIALELLAHFLKGAQGSSPADREV